MTGRPRDPNIPTQTRACPVHGEVDHRRHKHGKDRAGRPRFRWTCMRCHAETELAAYHSSKEA